MEQASEEVESPAPALAVSPLCGFGVSKHVKNNVLHVDDRHILHPLGKHIANYDSSTSETTFMLAGEGVPRVWNLALSPNKAYAAVVQSVPGEQRKLQCAVYVLAKPKRAKILHVDPKYSLAASIQALTFSGDGHLLVMATGEPEDSIMIWKWSSGKVLVADASSFPVHHISFNPWDGTQLVCVGESELNHVDFVEEELKLKADTLLYHSGLSTFTSHTWVRGTFVAVGSVTGQVGVFLRGEQKGCYQLMEHIPVICVAAHQAGFVILSHAMLSFFAPTEPDRRQSGREELFSIQQQIPLIFAKDVDPLHVSIAPTGVNLMLSTSGNEILQLDLQYLSDMSSGESRSQLTRAWSAFGSGAVLAPATSVTTADIAAASPTPLASAFHSSKVTCMEACPQMPIIATAAQDRELRIWNHRRQECVLKRLLTDDPVDLSLHCSGLMLLIAYSDRLQLLYILRSDLEEIAEFPLKKCSLCSFSNGGQLFAAAGVGNIITVWGCHNHQVLATFRGHASAISHMAWSHDDARLASVGAGGACYQWDVPAGVKIAQEEFVDKQKNYCCVQFCNNSSTSGVVVRSLDGKIQHIQGGVVVREGAVMPGTARGFALVGEHSALLAATASGAVSCHTWPLQPSASGQCELHEGSITHMALIENGSMLVTISSDGIMMLSSVDLLVKGLPIGHAPILDLPPVHLMRQSDLMAMDDRITDLKNQVKQVRIEYEYKLMLQPQQLNEQLREVNSARDAAEHARDEATAELNMLKATAADQQEQFLADMEAQHAVATEQLEAAYDHRFAGEHQRVQQLEQAKDDLQFSLEEKVRKVDAAHSKILQDTLAAYDQKLVEAEGKYNGVMDSMREAAAEYKEILSQYDLEFEEKGQQMSDKLQKLKEAAEFREVKLKGKNHILKTGHYRLKNELKSDHKKVEQLQEQLLSLESKCKDFQVNISALREEISERDTVIAQNYTTIQLLRRRLADMEKHKFVLGYRTQELEQELEPKEEQIENLNQQLQEQDGELVEELKRASVLTRGMSDQTMRIKSMKLENKELRQQLADNAALWRDLQHDLVTLNGIPEGKGRRQVEIQRLMTRYCSDKQARVNKSVEQEVIRQRDVAELKTNVLKIKLVKAKQANKVTVSDMVYENSALMKEIQEGRRALKEVQHTLQREREQAKALQLEYDQFRHQMGAGAKRQDPPGMEGVYNSSLPGTSEGDRLIQGASSLMLAPTPGSPTRPGTALARRPTTACPQTATTARGATGALVLGSPTRALNELVSEERERVIELLAALTASSDLVQQQRCQILDLKHALQARQLQSTTTISDGEDEDDDVFDTSTQPTQLGQLELTADQRHRSTRPQTAGPRQTPHPAQRPATAGQASLHDQQQRLSTPVVQSMGHQAAAKMAAAAIGSRPVIRRSQDAATPQLRRHSYTMSAARGARTLRPPSAGGTGMYFCNRDKYLDDYQSK
ncbi:TPA: WD repeat-containing protein 49 [Trebouxia sp. C0005]